MAQPDEEPRRRRNNVDGLVWSEIGDELGLSIPDPFERDVIKRQAKGSERPTGLSPNDESDEAQDKTRLDVWSPDTDDLSKDLAELEPSVIQPADEAIDAPAVDLYPPPAPSIHPRTYLDASEVERMFSGDLGEQATTRNGLDDDPRFDDVLTISDPDIAIWAGPQNTDFEEPEPISASPPRPDLPTSRIIPDRLSPERQLPERPSPERLATERQPVTRPAPSSPPPASAEAIRRRRWTLAIGAIAVTTLLAGAILYRSSQKPNENSVNSDTIPTDSTPVSDLPTSSGSLLPADEVSSEVIRIGFVGDINAENELESRLALDPEGFVGPYSEVLNKADLVIGNLESAITDGTLSPVNKQFTFTSGPELLNALRSGGIDVLSMANNHSYDYGQEGIAQGLQLTQNPDYLIGMGENEDDAFAPYITTVKGHRVAIIGATQVLDSNLGSIAVATADQPGLASAKDTARIVRAVTEARQVADTVVVFLHWGVETDECPSDSQTSLAAALSEAGADIIAGSHAHRVQGGGMLGNSAINYGLGNFLFKSNSAPGARTGAFMVDIAGRSVKGMEWIPGRITGSVPTPLEGAERDSELDKWNAQRACTGLSDPPAGPPGETTTSTATTTSTTAPVPTSKTTSTTPPSRPSSTRPPTTKRPTSTTNRPETTTSSPPTTESPDTTDGSETSITLFPANST